MRKIVRRTPKNPAKERQQWQIATRRLSGQPDGTKLSRRYLTRFGIKWDSQFTDFDAPITLDNSFYVFEGVICKAAPKRKYLGEGKAKVKLLTTQDGRKYALKIGNTLEENSFKQEHRILEALEQKPLQAKRKTLRGEARTLTLLTYHGDLDLFFYLQPKTNAHHEAKERLALLPIQIAQQCIAEVLNLHQKNILHCDIKPDNFVIDSEKNTVKLIDFGFSRQLRTRGNKIKLSRAIGTQQFLAPELQADDIYVSEKTDIYNLGLTLQELLQQDPDFAKISALLEQMTAEDSKQRPDIKTVAAAIAPLVAELPPAPPQPLASPIEVNVAEETIDYETLRWQAVEAYFESHPNAVKLKNHHYDTKKQVHTLTRFEAKDQKFFLEASYIRLGDQIFKYSPKRHYLGTGLNGNVKKVTARDGREYALKISTEQGAVSQQEMEIMRDIHRQPIVTATNTKTESGKTKYFFLMPLLGEMSLEQLLTSRQNKFRTLRKDSKLNQLEIAIECVDQVEQLHNGRLTGTPTLHGDIKPGNFTITENAIHLVDFGFSKTIQSKTDKKPGTHGTPYYIAPETGSTRKEYFLFGAPCFVASADSYISAYSDIYSLGKTLKELFPNQTPLAPLFARMMEKDPQKRIPLELVKIVLIAQQQLTEPEKISEKLTAKNCLFNNSELAIELLNIFRNNDTPAQTAVILLANTLQERLTENHINTLLKNNALITFLDRYHNKLNHYQLQTLFAEMLTPQSDRSKALNAAIKYLTKTDFSFWTSTHGIHGKMASHTYIAHLLNGDGGANQVRIETQHWLHGYNFLQRSSNTKRHSRSHFAIKSGLFSECCSMEVFKVTDKNKLPVNETTQKFKLEKILHWTPTQP